MILLYTHTESQLSPVAERVDSKQVLIADIGLFVTVPTAPETQPYSKY